MKLFYYLPVGTYHFLIFFHIIFSFDVSRIKYHVNCLLVVIFISPPDSNLEFLSLQWCNQFLLVVFSFCIKNNLLLMYKDLISTNWAHYNTIRLFFRSCLSLYLYVLMYVNFKNYIGISSLNIVTITAMLFSCWKYILKTLQQNVLPWSF